MIFVDQTEVDVQAGKGGDGAATFRHGKYIPLGGPAGGNGERGGSTILVADSGLRTLTDFRFRRKFRVDSGENGHIKSRYSRETRDIRLEVPMGASIYGFNIGELLGDLAKNGQELVVAHGGREDRGDIHFATPARIAPEVTEDGKPGEFRILRSELEVSAGVGLVGLPLAGKSALLSVVTKTKPRIVAYRFTTLAPDLGMVVLPDGRDFSMVDLPGLTEGTSKGTGLEIQFLRHVERTEVILHLVSADPNNDRDAYEDYETIRKELAGYTKDLTSEKEFIVATQMDIPGSEEKLAGFKRKLGDRTVCPISSVTHQDVNELVGKTADLVEEVAKEGAKKPTETKAAEEEYVYKKPEDNGFKVERASEHSFIITGNKLERPVQRTNLDYIDGIVLLAHKLERMGVDDALREKGAVNGDNISIVGFTFKLVD